MERSQPDPPIPSVPLGGSGPRPRRRRTHAAARGRLVAAGASLVVTAGLVGAMMLGESEETGSPAGAGQAVVDLPAVPTSSADPVTPSTPRASTRWSRDDHDREDSEPDEEDSEPDEEEEPASSPSTSAPTSSSGPKTTSTSTTRPRAVTRSRAS